MEIGKRSDMAQDTEGSMKLVGTAVVEDQVSYTWERVNWLSCTGTELKLRRVERCTLTINRHSDDSGMPKKDDPRWKVVE
jgi:hypothetical protein